MELIIRFNKINNVEMICGDAMEANLSGVDFDFLDQVGVDYLIEHFGKDAFLDEIGAQYCVEYFELKIKEERE